MIQWKQRLYAFLLRRWLGPVLTTESLGKLHACLDVSLQEGTFVLTEVGLKEFAAAQHGICIVSADIARLEIRFSLQEQDEAASSSLAWRALQLGSGPSVSLRAEIILDGVSIALEPCPKQPAPPVESRSIVADEDYSSTKSMLSSYLDAALASLRLSILVNDVRIRVNCPPHAVDKHLTSWIELRADSVLYRDVDAVTPAAAATAYDETKDYETSINKVVEVTHIKVATGEKNEEGDIAVSTVALLEGSSHVKLRVIEYNSNGAGDVLQESCSSRVVSRAQQDIEVTMNQKLNISVDLASLNQIQAVVNNFQQQLILLDDDASGAVPICAWGLNTDSETDEADCRAIDGIVKQIQEARVLADRKEVRGGILMPSIENSQTGEVTFDAFFDANEMGFSKYSSALKESIFGGGDGSVFDSDPGWEHTKLRFHLQDGGIKLAFVPEPFCQSQPDEYVLLTFSEVNLSSSISNRSSACEFSISSMELEDALGVVNAASGVARTVEINSLLRFLPNIEDDDDDTGILIQAPCLSLQVKTDNSNAKETIDVEVTFEPVEVSYRSASISKINRLLTSTTVGKEEPTTAEPKGLESDFSPKTLTVYVTCASISVVLPVSSKSDKVTTLYSRCGYTSEGALSTNSTLGLVFEQVTFERCDNESQTIIDSTVTCRNIMAFASSPNSQSIFDQTIQRFDVLALCGRNEVNPCIPITVKVTQCRRDSSEAAVDTVNETAVASFPKVPALSSFKARQEDEDSRIDEVLTSKLRGLDAHSRKDLRESDTQSNMLSETAKSAIVVSVHIPELIGDVSVTEVALLQSMVASLRQDEANERTSIVEVTSESKRVALSLDIDFVSLALHGEVHSSLSDYGNTSSVSFLTKVDRFKGHALVDKSKIKQTRILLHEVNFHEIFDLVQVSPFLDTSSMDQRVDGLRERGMCHADSIATPIFYRSHLFSPISPKSPCIVLDLVHVSTGELDPTQRNVYFTFYDMTYRHNFDSKWLKRLCALLEQVGGDESEEQQPVAGCTDQSLTRAFMSIADCNFDYTSSPKFNTKSRTILRLGEVLVSSNIMWPKTPVQAYSISVGDLSVLLCSSRFPYSFENGRLLEAETVLQPAEIMLATLRLPEDADSDTVLQAMNARTILTLDSLNAVIAVTNGNPKTAVDPSVCSRLTIGQLSAFACKDSFDLLMGTIEEATAQLTALTDEAVDALRAMSKAESINSSGGGNSPATDSVKDPDDVDDRASANKPFQSLDDLKHQSLLRPTVGWPSLEADREHSFLLDGYDWTTIDFSDDTGKVGIPLGEEQSARWYRNSDSSSALSEGGVAGGAEDTEPKEVTRIISHHFPLHPVSDPIGDGDMGIAKYVGGNARFQVKSRLLIHDFSVKLRFFDGYDWPELLDSKARAAPRGDTFLIPEVKTNSGIDDGEIEISDSHIQALEIPKDDRKAKIMGKLLSGSASHGNTFQNLPLPEERGRNLKEEAELRRLARRMSKYVQIEASGISIRLDSMEESSDHRLASCLNFKMHDFFVAEAISNNLRPVKMVGEWFNENEHPRDSKEGLVMMKMVTWHPACRVNSDNDIANDESEVGLKILPLRCLVDQRAVAFTRAFFASDDTKAPKGLPPGLHAVPPPLLKMFRVRSVKLKVDYRPQKLDSAALKNGAVVELINLSVLNSMVLTLKEVEVDNEIGFGVVIGILVRQWVQDICSTQLLKFVTKARPLEPISEVSGAMVDMVVLPWDAFRNGDSIQKALRTGTTSFSKTLVYEFFSLSSRAAEFLGGNVSWASSAAAARISSGAPSSGDLLPSRPLATPRHVFDATPHAVESLSRGFQEANYKIVIVPYREYQRNGATGAAKSVLKGIPVAIAAPVSGAAEALSFALLGARNQIRPDIRKEEEASASGLNMDS